MAAAVVATQYGGEQQLSRPSTCDSHPCKLPSSGGEFDANVAMILVVMLCALICALALNIAIRCSLRSQRRQVGRAQQQHGKANVQVEVQQPPSTPTLVYSVGMKLAGEAAECAICLSEFVEGEGIRVLSRCKHGFHVHCIHRWLSSSHTSCPTCRASCLPSVPVPSDEETGTANHNSVPDSF